MKLHELITLLASATAPPGIDPGQLDVTIRYDPRDPTADMTPSLEVETRIILVIPFPLKGHGHNRSEDRRHGQNKDRRSTDRGSHHRHPTST